MVTEEATEVGSSFLSHLMAKTSADAADVFRYIFDDDRQPLSLYERLESEDDNYSTDSTFGNFWKTFDENFIEEEQEEEDEAPLPSTSPFRKKTRNVYDRKPQDDSTWSRDYFIPTLREKYIIDPHGRHAKKFRRLFRVPYDLFVGLVGMCKERWWKDWMPEKIDAAGKLVSSLE